jgi:hypothetical protein
MFNFSIQPKGIVSDVFLAHHIYDFETAANWVKQLPYKRNQNKAAVLCVFDEQCGTCSTKHALLARLATEQNQSNVQLMLGIFALNAHNTSKVTAVLAQHHLPYLPEAHNYLRIDGQIVDCTALCPINFVNNLLTEIVIKPHQINQFKVAYHQQYLTNWLAQMPQISYNLSSLWQIRKQCIAALQQ